VLEGFAFGVAIGIRRSGGGAEGEGVEAEAGMDVQIAEKRFACGVPVRGDGYRLQTGVKDLRDLPGRDQIALGIDFAIGFRCGRRCLCGGCFPRGCFCRRLTGIGDFRAFCTAQQSRAREKNGQVRLSHDVLPRTTTL
jgi:hypothetical protein